MALRGDDDDLVVGDASSPTTDVTATSTTLGASTTVVEPTTTIAPTTTVAAMVTDPLPTTDETTTTVAETTTTTTIAAVAGPFPAINADGAAVLVDSSGASTLLFQGPDPDDPGPTEGESSYVASVAVQPGGATVYVGLCCEPVVGTIFSVTPPTPGSWESPWWYGSALAISPDGLWFARVTYDQITVSDAAFNDIAAVPEDFELGQTYDLAWSADGARLYGIRLGHEGWTVRSFAFDGTTLTEQPSVLILPLAAAAPVQPVGFAGARGDLLFVAGIDTMRVQAYDTVSLAPRADADIVLGGSATSAWVDSDGTVRWTDDARRLHV
ncbi:MAG TPA: hypothetical protein PLV68_21635, partial [Ilumatobacteraceae bacterium]|nr:hypothetical protein [Ilumatobacteraceae bacterium]